jgi:hypothetical protein
MFKVLLQYFYEWLGTGGKHKTPQDSRSYGPDSKQCSYSYESKLFRTNHLRPVQIEFDTTLWVSLFSHEQSKEKYPFDPFSDLRWWISFCKISMTKGSAYRSFLRWWINVLNRHVYASAVLWTFYFPRRLKPMLPGRMNVLNIDHVKIRKLYLVSKKGRIMFLQYQHDKQGRRIEALFSEIHPRACNKRVYVTFCVDHLPLARIWSEAPFS